MSVDSQAVRARRVLIVDDDRDLLESMGLMFRKRGFEVFVAGDAESALHAIPTVRPELVLTDLRLPRKSGLDLVREVHVAFPEIPLLIMTAYGSEDVIQIAERLGTPVLTKPLQREELFRTVGRALGS